MLFSTIESSFLEIEIASLKQPSLESQTPDMPLRMVYGENLTFDLELSSSRMMESIFLQVLRMYSSVHALNKARLPSTESKAMGSPSITTR